MTDYDYGDQHIRLDDNDSSKNKATGLSDYSLEVTPDRNWPGTSANPKQQRFDTHKMRLVADRIDSYVTSLEGGGVKTIAQTAAVSFGPPSWNAAVYLQKASGDVATLVGQYSAQLVENLRAAASSIRAAADQYDGAEDTNMISANNQHRSLDGNRTGNTQTSNTQTSNM
ncbi:MAG TPA: hypothetical protein VLJ59_10205 [Mycobacteriales bacterium]|nr:hypothetical protein [Mycobacteriales bacterium]